MDGALVIHTSGVRAFMDSGEVQAGRSANHMAPEIKAVHYRLIAWGKWAHERMEPWPERTWLGKLVDGETVRTHNRPPVSMPDDIAVVDAAVGRLGAIDRKAIEACYHYRDDPVEAMARRAKMRVRQFQNVLKRARWRICGYIDARES